MFLSVAADTIFTARYTSMEGRSISFCAETAGSWPRKLSFVKRLRPSLHACRRRSLSMVMCRAGALWLLRREHPCWRNVTVRTNKYLNNVIEQDHRAIKRRCASMAGFKSIASAAITLAGIELAHRVRKRQFSFGRGRQRRSMSLRRLWDLALA